MEKHTPQERQITDWVGRKRITWCGPYAVAVVSGCGYEQAYQVARKVRNKRHAKGISNMDLKKSCTKLGVKGKWHKLEKRTQLKKFLPTLEAGKVYVVQITKHFIVVDTRDYTTIDNQNPEWTAMESSKHMAKLVHNFFEVHNPKFDVPEEDWLFQPMAA